MKPMAIDWTHRATMKGSILPMFGARIVDKPWKKLAITKVSSWLKTSNMKPQSIEPIKPPTAVNVNATESVAVEALKKYSMWTSVTPRIGTQNPCKNTTENSVGVSVDS